MTAPRPFSSPETALGWLNDRLADEAKGWRVEMSAEWYGVERIYIVRAYSMMDHAGWCSGQDTTLIGALAWLRHAVEDFMRKEPIT